MASARRRVSSAHYFWPCSLVLDPREKAATVRPGGKGRRSNGVSPIVCTASEHRSRDRIIGLQCQTGSEHSLGGSSERSKKVLIRCLVRGPIGCRLCTPPPFTTHTIQHHSRNAADWAFWPQAALLMALNYFLSTLLDPFFEDVGRFYFLNNV